ncbi:antibiotic resistance protein VanZ [Haloplanus halophilus]|uniref:antibiotic resistance protein VanZ n=1 Tax=Haloplanus halophilus TaxID=2949993 RepID=UPI00203EAE86|nr:antibiotic resistance protein VanZ [Haloplanus sp. GDY1]
MSRTRRSSITVGLALALLVASVLNPRWLGASGPGSAGTAWLHLVGYAALGAALVRPGWRGAAVAVVVATGYGAGIELLQAGLAHRTASLADAAINGAGATLGVAGRIALRRGRSPPTDG